FRPVGDGVKRRAHDADLKRMVVIRSPSPQLVPFKLHRFGQQRRKTMKALAVAIAGKATAPEFQPPVCCFLPA
ncbi:hypothetical protein, partial [Aeromonas enteropelogenes]|uniref:hypothetical protein n=1 Tax=Aeromonas enteropelogenes TaxID=29489 RepID=UPI001E5450E1